MLRNSVVMVVLYVVFVLVPIKAQEDLDFTGTIDNDNPVAVYPLALAGAEENIVIELNSTSGDLDPLLYLIDTTGKILAQNDDRVRGNRNSLIVLPALADGTYYVVATRYDGQEGQTTGEYELTVAFEGIRAMEYAVDQTELSAVGFPEIEPRSRANWTIFAYYGADTDLEAGLLDDFREFEMGGGSDESVRVVMLIDRTARYSDAAGDWDNTRLYEVSAANGEDFLASEPLAELPELNMGDGQVLANFLTWGLNNFPAEHYAVAFASHGAGWQGLITDETSNQDILSIPELAGAFAEVIKSSEIEGFDLLVNDACLMSSVEYYAMATNYFTVSYASPEVVINPALNMTDFLEALRANPDADIQALGQELVDRYLGQDVTSSNLAGYLTHAVSNLERFDEVITAVTAFATLVRSDMQAYGLTIGEARSNAYTYTTFMDDSTRIDLGDFMQKVIAESRATELKEAAQVVLDALATVRVYGDAGDAARTNYYNIYFPASNRDFTPNYLQESIITEWGLMLEDYFTLFTPARRGNEQPTRLSDEMMVLVQAQLGDAETITPDTSYIAFHEPLVPQVKVSSSYPQVGDYLHPFYIQFEIVGRNIAVGDFIADFRRDDGSYVRYNIAPIYTSVPDEDGEFYLVNEWESGVSTGGFVWETYLPVVSDGTNTHTEFAIETLSDVAAIEGRYREPDGEDWHDISVLFDAEVGGAVQQVMGRSRNGALGAITVTPNSEFQVYQRILTIDGETQLEPGNIYNWGENGVTLDYAPAPDGTYRIGFRATTYSGVNGMDSIEVVVDNSHVNPDWQAFIDVDLGIEMEYPSWWSILEPYIEDDVELWDSEDEETGDYLLIYPFYDFDPELDDLDTVFENFLDSDYGGELYDAWDDNVEDGIPALYFDFITVYDDVEWVATAVAFYNPAVNIAYVVAVYTLDDINEIAWIIDELELIQIGSTRDWDFVNVDEEGYVAMPLLNSWDVASEELEAGYILQTYFPTDVEETATSPYLATLTIPLSDEDAENLEATIETTFDEFVNEFIIPDAENYTVQEPRLYYGEYNDWSALLYEFERDGVPMVGRAYVTDFATEQWDALIFLWFEVPREQTDLIYNVFEVMVDGVQIYWDE